MNPQKSRRRDRPGGPTDVTAFIRSNLPVRALASIPEIAIHTARPTSGLQRIASAASPYWAYAWAGGLAIARHVLDNPQTVANRRVLDLGAGSGVVAIAAAKAGAACVFAAETDPNGAVAIGVNAALNSVVVQVIAEDITGGEPPAVDIILVGDLFYAQDLAVRVLAFLDRCIADGIIVLIGDPYRAHLPRDRLALIAEYQVADFGEVTENTTSAVLSLQPPA